MRMPRTLRCMCVADLLLLAIRSDLEKYKDNMWGLLGLYQCLQQAGDPEVRLACVGLPVSTGSTCGFFQGGGGGAGQLLPL